MTWKLFSFVLLAIHILYVLICYYDAMNSIEEKHPGELMKTIDDANTYKNKFIIYPKQFGMYEFLIFIVLFAITHKFWYLIDSLPALSFYAFYSFEDVKNSIEIGSKTVGVVYSSRSNSAGITLKEGTYPYFKAFYRLGANPDGDHSEGETLDVTKVRLKVDPAIDCNGNNRPQPIELFSKDRIPFTLLDAEGFGLLSNNEQDEPQVQLVYDFSDSAGKKGPGAIREAMEEKYVASARYILRQYGYKEILGISDSSQTEKIDITEKIQEHFNQTLKKVGIPYHFEYFTAIPEPTDQKFKENLQKDVNVSLEMEALKRKLQRKKEIATEIFDGIGGTLAQRINEVNKQDGTVGAKEITVLGRVPTSLILKDE